MSYHPPTFCANTTISLTVMRRVASTKTLQTECMRERRIAETKTVVYEPWTTTLRGLSVGSI